MGKKLTKTELLKMDNNSLQQRVLFLEKENLKLKKSVEILNNEKRNAESKSKLNLIDSQIRNREAKLENIKEENREFNKKIKDKYKIKKGFGVRPETGEIIEDE